MKPPMRPADAPARRYRQQAPVVLLLGVSAWWSGCAQTAWVRVREAPANPLAGPLKLLSPGGPEPTDRTLLLARRDGLEYELKSDPGQLRSKLTRINKTDRTAAKPHP